MSEKKGADKRADKSNKQTNKQAFKSSPFSSMKGLCVSTPPSEDSRVKPQRTEPKPEPTRAPEPAKDADFTTEMGSIGVHRLEDQDNLFVGDMGEMYTKGQVETVKKVSSFIADELSDEDLFLHHLGQMDAVFNDSYPDTETSEQQTGVAQRMRQLRKGRLRPEATLDLHGCYREEARKKVRVFLQNRHLAKMKTVLIITGRGQGSKGGEPVLRSDIETYLRTKASAWVVEWGRAPKQYGGDGALVVFLRN
ncbi:MAG: Smr/MutS family protein [Desulfuromonas sp.]|nr:Smr/MutS family protein [Desulfuromonas sp.]